MRDYGEQVYEITEADTMRRPSGIVSPPIETMRKHCLECMGNSSVEVERCSAPKCWLYPYRLGFDPRREKKELTAAQLDALKRGREIQHAGGVPGQS